MRSKNRKFKRARAVGVAVGLMAGLAAGELAAEPVNAANGWEIDLNVGSDIQEASSVTITIGSGNNSAMLIPKNSDKAAGIIRQTASVEIGATNGYTITVSGNPNLTGNNASNKIPSVSSATTLQQMNNQWGWYNVDGDVSCNETSAFRAMTSAGELVASGSLDAKTTKQITMCFGAKVNTSQAADNYSNSVVISAVAQPKSITTFGGIKTMQEMTPSICKAASENDTAYLRDMRDGNYYWITKLLDGNCWMSQNLALDLSTNKTLTSADSDVTSSWTPEYSTLTSIGSGADSSDNTGTHSWNLGDYVLNTPAALLDKGCGGTSGIGTGLADCSAQGFVNVAGWTASSDPNFYKNNKSSTSVAAKTYDAHYLIGNYYQWNAATAGTGGGAKNIKATGSICPKNWKLPSSGDLTTNGTIGWMLSRYGVERKINVAAGGFASPVNSHEYDIALSPLFFVRGGNIGDNMASAPLWGAGKEGHYWSSLAGSEIYYAYGLSFNNDSVSPSDGYSMRYAGMSVRCLVEVL